jgi:hypothetical protein
LLALCEGRLDLLHVAGMAGSWGNKNALRTESYWTTVKLSLDLN